MEIGRIDLAPARSAYTIREDGRDLIWTLEIRGEYGLAIGELDIRAKGDLATGRLLAQTARIQE